MEKALSKMLKLEKLLSDGSFCRTDDFNEKPCDQWVDQKIQVYDAAYSHL